MFNFLRKGFIQERQENVTARLFFPASENLGTKKSFEFRLDGLHKLSVKTMAHSCYAFILYSDLHIWVSLKYLIPTNGKLSPTIHKQKIKERK